MRRRGAGSPTSRRYDAAKEIGERIVADFTQGLRRGRRPRRSTSSTPGSARWWPRSRARCACCRSRSSTRTRRTPADDEVLPLYEFEPSIEQVLDAVLPKYVTARIWTCLLGAAASQLAAAAAGDEVGDRQRRRPHQDLHPAGEPGPPGRDHPGDQRDRRRRRRPGRQKPVENPSAGEKESTHDRHCHRRAPGDPPPAPPAGSPASPAPSSTSSSRPTGSPSSTTC